MVCLAGPDFYKDGIISISTKSGAAPAMATMRRQNSKQNINTS